MLVPLFLLLVYPACGMGSAPKPPAAPDKNTLVIEDFENVDPKKGPEWWSFDNISMNLVAGNDSRHALELKGATRNWYVGGVGKYIGKDASRYSTFDLDVFGTGPESGI